MTIRLILLLIIGGMLTISCSSQHTKLTEYEKLPIGAVISRTSIDLNTGEHYASSAWPAAHRDCRNSDHFPFYTTKDVHFSWIELEHAGFFIGPTIGPEGNVYLPTGYGSGYSNLICYDRAGNELWRSEPLKKGELEKGVDYGCEINAPTIDEDGNIYQVDLNQIWSFTPTGEIRWVTNLREHGIHGTFVSPFFTKEGYLGGNSTDGFVTLFDRNTGKMVFDKLKLPGTKGPISLPMFEGLWETQIGDEFRQFTWDATFGRNMQCSNTPAVEPNSGRIFIVANGFSENEGMIHGVDVTENGLELAFSTSTGDGGSGTSPTITFDGRQVLLTDGSGWLNAINTRTGEIIWRIDTKSVTAVSSTVTPSGLAINYSFERVTAYDSTNGDLVWEIDLDKVVADKEMKGLIARRSRPTAVAASSILATADKLWMIVISGAKMGLTEKQQKKRANSVIPMKGLPTDSIRVPQSYYLCSFDYDGNLLSKTPAPGDGAMVTAGLDGRIYISGLSVVSDIMYNKTPALFRTTPKPTVGVWGFEPDSYIQQAKEAIHYLHNNKRLSNSLRKGQLEGIRISLLEAQMKGEINKNTASKIEQRIGDILEKDDLITEQKLQDLISLIDAC